MKGKIVGAIWEGLAVKRGRWYLATFLILLLSAVFTLLHDPSHVTPRTIALAFVATGTMAIGAVRLVLLIDKLRLRRAVAREKGLPTALATALLIGVTVLGILAVALLVAVAGLPFLR